MIDLGVHAGYIIASYGVAVVILGGMILGSLLGYRAAAKRLAALEARTPPKG
jgi:heme exporter protein D